MDRFGDGIRNLYQQADGFLLFWMDPNHPDYKERWLGMSDRYAFEEVMHPASEEDPSACRSQLRVYEMERFPFTLGGVCWMLPSSDALHQEKEFLGIYRKDEPFMDDEVEVYGRTIELGDLLRGIRTIDLGLQYYPVGLWMEEGEAEPPVLVGDDHGANWESGSLISFEDYLESLLHRHFTLAARKELVHVVTQKEAHWQERMSEQPIEDLLHEPPEPMDTAGGTFEVRVETIEDCDQTTARGILIHANADRFWRGAAKLGLLSTDLEKRLDCTDIHGNPMAINPSAETRIATDATELRRQIAEVTADINGMTMKDVRKLCGSHGFYLEKKTKTVFKEAMFADFDQPVDHVVVSVTTKFDLDSIRVPTNEKADRILFSRWRTQARGIARREIENFGTVAAIPESRQSSYTNQAARFDLVIEHDELTYVFDLIVHKGHDLEEGRVIVTDDHVKDYDW